MKIFVSAAEISSDIHAEKIVREIRDQINQQGKEVQIAGIGGPRLRSIPGFYSLENAENLRVMGFVEVLGKISFLKKTRQKLLHYLQENSPDLMITFDYPDFHLSLMKQIRNQEIAKQALKICAIPPKVWVWRSKRVEKIRNLYDGVLVIFPFEKKFYQEKSIPVIYEGNPLIADLFENANDNKIENVKGESEKVVTLCVMPGSRDAELKYHLPLIPKTLELFSEKIQKKLRVMIPIPKGVESKKIEKNLISSHQIQYEFISDGALSSLKQASFGLIKSGTSTLEAALLGCVPVIFYKTNPITEWIMRYLVRYSGPVGLPNILLGIKKRKDAVYPEFLGYEATPHALANELYRLYQNEEALTQLKNKGISLQAELVPHKNVPREIAIQLLEWIKTKPFSPPKVPNSIFILLSSWLWSMVNALRRILYQVGLRKTYVVPLPSVLFGNLQVGGAGKTPLLIETAREALKRGLRVAVVTRGYRGTLTLDSEIIDPKLLKIDPRVYGDEAAEIKLEVPGVFLAVGADRVKSVKDLLKFSPVPDLILFDDGFQNLKFRAARTVLCKTDFKRSQVLFRDFEKLFEEADLVIKTKGTEPLDLKWEIESFPQMPTQLWCGLGDPQEVIHFCAKKGLYFQKVILKRDHAEFNAAEVNAVLAKAHEQGQLVLVTVKDFVKLQALGVQEYSTPLAKVNLPEKNTVGVLRRKLVNFEIIDQILGL